MWLFAGIVEAYPLLPAPPRVMLTMAFAQEAPHEPQTLSEVPIAAWIVLGVGFVLLAALLFAFRMVLRHLKRNRELLHAERNKALEVGQPPHFSPPDRARERYSHSSFWIAFWVGAVLPMAAVGSAAAATAHGQFANIGYVIMVWIAVTLISVAGVVGATIVMVSARGAASDSVKTAPRPLPEGHGH